MFSAGDLVGLLGAADKPGGFTDADVQLLSMFAGPVATFVRSRQIYDRERRHASRLERLAALVGDMTAVSGRSRAPRAHRPAHAEGPRLRARGLPRRPRGRQARAGRGSGGASGRGRSRTPRPCAGRSGSPRPSRRRARRRSPSWRCPSAPATTPWASSSCASVRPPRSTRRRRTCSPPSPALSPSPCAGRRARPPTEHMARQMATLYDLGLETSALRDLQSLFLKATEEAGRLIQADHTSVFRHGGSGGRAPPVRGLVARPGAAARAQADRSRWGRGSPAAWPATCIPVLINDAEKHESFVRRGHPVSRILCVPLTYFDRERNAPVVFGVLNATRVPGSPRVHRRRPRVPHPLRRPALDRGGQLRGLRRGAQSERAARPRQRPPARDRGQPLARAHPRDGGAAHPRGLPLSRGRRS